MGELQGLGLSNTDTAKETDFSSESDMPGYVKALMCVGTVAILAGAGYIAGTQEMPPRKVQYVQGGSRSHLVGVYSGQIRSYRMREDDPQKMEAFLEDVYRTAGSEIALNALLFSKNTGNEDLIPTDAVEFRKLAKEIARTQGLNSDKITPGLIRQLYANEARSFLYGDPKLTALGVGVDAVRRETGLTKRRELIDAHMRAGTIFGGNVEKYIGMHSGNYPPEGEITLMQSTGQAYAVPYDNARDRDTRDPNVTHVSGLVDQMNSPSSLQAEQPGAQSNQRAQQDMQSAADAAGRAAQGAADAAGQRIGNAINGLLNPKKKQ